MAKIETYVLATQPLSFSDMLIGTEINGPIPNATKNFSLSELYALFATAPTTINLQQVLNAGNIATQNIVLTGDITSTSIKPQYIYDISNLTGSVGEVVMRVPSGIAWSPLIPPNLQQVLDAGNIATKNVTLNGNLSVTKIIPGEIQDVAGLIGTSGQILYKTSVGILWGNLPIGSVSSVTASSPLASSGGTTPNITIQQANGSQDGYLSSGDWTSFNSKLSDAPSDGTTYGRKNGSWSAAGTVSSVSTSGLISGGPIITTGTITTSVNTNKLVGRYSSGTGVMEEITIGTGLNLSAGGTLTATGSSGGGISHGTASGTDTYAVTISGVTSYADGDSYLVRFTNGNTTGATLNINSLGAKVLYRNNDGPIIGGDIESGSEMLCVFNSTLNGFQIIGTSPNSLIAYVTNDDSVTITKGQPVYAFSGQGDRLTVKLAYNTTDAASAQTIGLVMSPSITPNGKGFIMMQGLLDGLSILPTATWSDGDPVYLGATAGTITNIKPSAPNHLVYLGFVTTANNGSAGRLYVRVQNGYELQELHNVALTNPPNNNDGLFYESSTSLWKNKSISTVLGYTPQAALNGGTGLVKSTAGAITYITDNSTNWDTAYSDRMKWDGGATGLSASTGRTSLGATTVGSNFFTLTNPSAVTFPRINVDNTVSALDASNFRTAIGTSALSQASYTMLANNTNAAANMAAQTFRDVASATYTGAITWTAGTQPSGATNHSYRWTQIGKLVTVNVSLIYATVGATITSVVMDLPSDCPTPVIPAGISGNSRILYYGSGNMTGNSLLGSTASRAGLIINSTSTGYSLQISAGSAGYNWASITVQYFTS